MLIAVVLQKLSELESVVHLQLNLNFINSWCSTDNLELPLQSTKSFKVKYTLILNNTFIYIVV